MKNSKIILSKIILSIVCIFGILGIILTISRITPPDINLRNKLIKKGFEASYSWGYKECSQRFINGELKSTNWDSLYKVDYKKFKQYLEESLEKNSK